MLQTLKTNNSQQHSILQFNPGSPLHNTDLFQLEEIIQLECGDVLSQLKISYSTYGKLNADKSNVIWVCHALTADANPKDWWQGLVGKDDFYNPKEYFIVCANVIGSAYGSTSPLDCDLDKRYEQFPTISIRDNVNAFIELRKHLKIDSIHTLIGGSMGGHQAVEWAILEPNVVEHLILLATSAVMSAWSTAFNQSQRLAIQADESFGKRHPEAGKSGLKAARSIALLSYRNNQAYNQTQVDTYDFNRTTKAVSYQNYQGDKLVSRFNAYSYFALTKTMDSHDVGRNRGGVEQALSLIKAKTLVIAIDSDILFPVADSKILAKHIPSAKLQVIGSDFGHDGFLIETTKISKCLASFYTQKHNLSENKGTIGMVGLGCVGQGVFQLLENSKNQIKSIAVKHEFKARNYGCDLLTTQLYNVLNDSQIKTIVEAIDDDIKAFDIAKSAIRQGKSLISANKKMIAENLSEIIRWNKNHESSFLYEAAVAGSIPILRSLDNYFEHENNQKITGILNGSSNYILTQLFQSSCNYQQALEQAQAKGYAESNPISDVGGFDAKYKAVILAAHAFGFLIHPDLVNNYGIQNISDKDIAFAKANNLIIKQVVTIEKNNQAKIAVTVLPEFIDEREELAKTDNENNTIIVHNNDTDFLFKGAGAGSIATATAITADLNAINRNYSYQYDINPQLALDTGFSIKLYINKQHLTQKLQGKIIEETNDYLIIETCYDELNRIDTHKNFIAKIN